MNSQRTPAGITDEEWIAKYRAALNALPVQKSRWTKLRAAFDQARSILLRNAGHVFRRGVDVIWPSSASIRGEVSSSRPALGSISHDKVSGVTNR
jgi:hypothetical protein